MDQYVSIGKLCKILGISLSTAYRWLKSGKIFSDFNTVGQHRRFNINRIKIQFDCGYIDVKRIVTYARVSSHDQKKDLETQSLKLKSYTDKHYINNDVIHIQDLGSGLNYKKKGLLKLLSFIFNRQIDVLVVNHTDRLLRFGSDIIFLFCKIHNIEVIILEKHEDKLPFEQELAQDVIALMTVFCAKLYGKRSNKNKLIY